MLNPEWNTTFSFDVKDLFHDLIISVYDEDKSSGDDFLGRICIPLGIIQNNHNIEYQLKTMDCEKFFQGKIGNMRLYLLYISFRPYTTLSGRNVQN